MIPHPYLVTSAFALLVGSGLGGAFAAPASAASGDPARATSPGIYVVSLAAAPAASYGGGVDGLRATRPVGGARFDRTRPAVTAYTTWLHDRQDRVLRRVGAPAVLYRYTTALDGFAVSLTGDQVRRLRATPGVLRVERSTRQHVDATRSAGGVASSSRVLLGLDGTRGAWARHGGPDRAGRGVVVGVVDSGIWPGNPSFNGIGDRTPGTAPALRGFHGACDAAESWLPDDCSDKVVSARWFVKGFGAENTASAEYLSPRDGSGHGSHVASTAAGDHGVRVAVDGEHFGTTSGMAPAARLAVYKACWAGPDPSDDGCTTADSVAALDQAVADGVDVVNFSVSGSSRRDDTVERAFLGAASAGVFVATSAGNGGPSHHTVTHVAPWVTTVAASTHHVFSGAVRLGSGASFVGAMVSDTPVRSSRLVLGSDVGGPDATRTAARHCEPGSLDAASVQGRIVVCERGDGARVDKSASVAQAGAVAMVLTNVGPGSTDADVHAVPTVHVGARAGAAVRSYVHRAGKHATATLDPGARERRQVPSMADFSARGPVRGSGDVLKPDLTAPGVSVLGAVAPPSDSGRSWDLMSGTSTSAPHVAGLAAFILGVHPDWAPARVKSAMMTTAYDVAGRDGPLAEGAGHVDPSRFLDPGLVFDTPASAWRSLAAGTLKARDVNAPSIAIGDLIGHTTVTRKLTNVSGRSESYAARESGLRDVDVQAFPATVQLAAGESRTVRIRVTARPTATVDRDVSGWLVWHGDRHLVRMPVAVRPTVVAAPDQVDGSGRGGRVVVHGRSGNGRTVKLHSTGLVAARSTAVTVAAPTDLARPSAQQVRVPSGTDLARFAATRPATGDPIDVSVYRSGRLVARSSDATPEVTLSDPLAGDYRVVITGSGVDAATGSAQLLTWVVPRTGGTQVDLSTDAVGFAPGQEFRYSASWDGLDPSKHYLGAVGYGDSDRRTVVEVNPGTGTAGD